jgi:hypothetical protein
MDAIVQVFELALQSFTIRIPRHPIDTRRGLFPQPAIRRPKQWHIEMVQQGGEWFPFSVLRGLPYTIQPMGHTSPTLGSVGGVLFRVPLGPFPWLHRLRQRLPAFVHRLHSYYGRV